MANPQRAESPAQGDKELFPQILRAVSKIRMVKRRYGSSESTVPDILTVRGFKPETATAQKISEPPSPPKPRSKSPSEVRTRAIERS
jgi:hypothetical protein